MFDTYGIDTNFSGGMVARAANVDAFVLAARDDRYRSVVMTPENWPAEREALKTAYEAWRQPRSKNAIVPISLDMSSPEHPVIKTTTDRDNYPQIFVDELVKMAVLYARITNVVDLYTIGRIDENMNLTARHPAHAFTVLNRVLFGEGTVLKDESGKEIGTVSEGDYLYMQKHMEHHSTYHDPAAPGLPRLTLAIF